MCRVVTNIMTQRLRIPTLEVVESVTDTRVSWLPVNEQLVKCLIALP